MTFDNPRNQTAAVRDFLEERKQRKRSSLHSQLSSHLASSRTHSLNRSWKSCPFLPLLLLLNKNFADSSLKSEKRTGWGKSKERGG